MLASRNVRFSDLITSVPYVLDSPCRQWEAIRRGRPIAAPERRGVIPYYRDDVTATVSFRTGSFRLSLLLDCYKASSQVNGSQSWVRMPLDTQHLDCVRHSQKKTGSGKRHSLFQAWTSLAAWRHQPVQRVQRSHGGPEIVGCSTFDVSPTGRAGSTRSVRGSLPTLPNKVP